MYNDFESFEPAQSSTRGAYEITGSGIPPRFGAEERWRHTPET